MSQKSWKIKSAPADPLTTCTFFVNCLDEIMKCLKSTGMKEGYKSTVAE